MHRCVYFTAFGFEAIPLTSCIHLGSQDIWFSGSSSAQWELQHLNDGTVEGIRRDTEYENVKSSTHWSASSLLLANGEWGKISNQPLSNNGNLPVFFKAEKIFPLWDKPYIIHHSEHIWNSVSYRKTDFRKTQHNSGHVYISVYLQKTVLSTQNLTFPHVIQAPSWMRGADGGCGVRGKCFSLFWVVAWCSVPQPSPQLLGDGADLRPTV